MPLYKLIIITKFGMINFVRKPVNNKKKFIYRKETRKTCVINHPMTGDSMHNIINLINVTMKL